MSFPGRRAPADDLRDPAAAVKHATKASSLAGGKDPVILDTLAARHIPVLLSGMYAPPNLGPEYGRAFRAVIDKLGRRPGILYDPFFLQGVALDPALHQADGIHPNAAGVRRIVARLLPEVEKLLAKAPAS